MDIPNIKDIKDADLPDIPQERIDEAVKMIESKQSPHFHEIMGRKDEMDSFLDRVNKTHGQI